jgi:dihydropteroate synthase
MAIINATPDSFFSDSRLANDRRLRDAALERVLEDGPDIIDVGGQSTRPGSERVGVTEELARVIPVIRRIRERNDTVPITIDTYHAAVAAEAMVAGADGVNDISAGRFDPALWNTVAQAGCGYVLMHMQGSPESMQRAPAYKDCVEEVSGFLSSKLLELQALGVDPERIVLDPGIGFGKRVEDNLALIHAAKRVGSLGRPLLYGVSRKSFVGALSAAGEPGDRLPGTLGIIWDLLTHGVMLHRVHDVGEVRQLFALWRGLQEARVPREHSPPE